jgi:hypothetical protein
LQDIETYSYDFYDETTAQSWLRRHAGHLVLTFGIIASILATIIIGTSSNDLKLAFVYLLACATCLSFLFACRKDILSPIGIATIWYIFGFLLSVPFYTCSEYLYPVAPSSAAFTQTVGLSLVGLWAFAIGSISGFQRIFRPMFRWVTQTKTPLRPSGHGQFILILIWLLIGGAIRLYFNVGRATEYSAIKITYVTGIIQFMFNDGSLILIGLFLYRCFERSKLFIMEGYVLFIGYSATQLLLGWKGAIFGALILFTTLLWYQRGGQRRRSFVWALIMILFVPLTMQIGYAIRSIGYTGTAESYATGSTEFLLKTVTRLDGNARFAKVLEYETKGQGISLTNGFKIISLIRSGMVTVQYADMYIHKITLEQKTSTGASGPGGAYIALGLSGIIVGYFLLGAVYRSIHNLVKNFSDPTLAIVFYGYMIYILMSFFSENFVVSYYLKRAFVCVTILVLSRFLLKVNEFYIEDLTYAA